MTIIYTHLDNIILQHIKLRQCVVNHNAHILIKQNRDSVLYTLLKLVNNRVVPKLYILKRKDLICFIFTTSQLILEKYSTIPNQWVTIGQSLQNMTRTTLRWNCW